MLSYFIISYVFIAVKKRKILFGDIFILFFYLFLLTAVIFVSLYFYRIVLPGIDKTLFTVLVGITSKILLALITYIMTKCFKYQIIVPNKQYVFVILAEISILMIFSIILYSITNIQKTYNPIIICILLIFIFMLVIMNGIYFNDIYNEKLKLEKRIQKEKYIQQSLVLIKNINYDISRKEHQVYWILEKIRQLNNEKNKEITAQINEFQSQNKKMSIYSKNLVFDTVLTIKINKLIDRNITIKPLLEIESNEKYDDLEFVNTISEILDYIQNNNDVTLHIRNHGMYILVKLYSLQEFYNYDSAIYQSDLIIDKSQSVKNDIYYVRFLLRGQDEIIGEKL